MAYAGPGLLTGEHLPDGFDWGKPAPNEWLIGQALNNRQLILRRQAHS
jgi:hypothetical protein